MRLFHFLAGPPSHRLVAASAIAWSILGRFSQPAPAAAPTFVPNVPDFFQHQKFGADTDPGASKTWERNAKGNGAGWCYYAATADQLYTLKKKGYAVFPATGNDITDPAKWLGAANTEIQGLFTDITNAQDNPSLDPLLDDPVNQVLDARKVGPNQGVISGLLHNELFQDGANLAYLSSDTGAKMIFQRNTTAAEMAVRFLRNGDTASLRLTHKTKTDALWWSGDGGGDFHQVDVAGYDALAPTKLWLADPDSNPNPGSNDGNKNTNAGFTRDLGNTAVLNQIKARRFRDTDPIPVAAAPPSATDISKRFLEAPLSNDKKQLNVTAADFNRFDGVDVAGVSTVEVVKGAAKPPPAPGGPNPGAAKEFQVSPGQTGAIPIDEFWLFPASTSLTSISSFTDGMGGSLPDWQFQLVAPGAGVTDPWGNLRPEGYLHACSGCDPNAPDEPLLNTDLLQFNYETASGNALPGWDIVFDYQQDPNNLTVQVFGGAVNPNFLQDVPEPSWGAALLGILLAIQAGRFAGRSVSAASLSREV